MIVLLEKKKNSYNSSYTYNYAVLQLRDNGPNVVFYYNSLNEAEYLERKKTKEVLKPNSYSFTNAKDVWEFNLENKGKYSHSDCVELKVTPEEEGLYIPNTYIRKEFSLKQTKDDIITDEMFEKIKQLKFSTPIILLGESPEHAVVNNTVTCSYEYYCTKCNHLYYPTISNGRTNNSCPICKQSVYNHNLIVMKEFKVHRQKEFDTKRWTTAVLDEPITKKDRFYYMTAQNNGLILYRIAREITCEKNTILEHYSVEYSLEHFVGEKIVSYKHLKKSKKEVDAFEVLNINTKNINSVPSIIYEDACDFFDFATKNEKFLRMSGFQSVLKYTSVTLDLEPFFIIFLGIVNKYPIMEQIIKMGHARLFFNIYQNMLQCLNKDEINRNVEKVSQIVDNEATKGKDALRFPIYIGDYLIKKNASLEEYFYWRDLYEITKITKEQFENFTESFNFAWVNSQAGVEDISNILKFEYPVEKLFNYIVKQARDKKITVSTVIRNLGDYLNMCDITQIEADKYPQDVVKQHNEMLAYFRKREKAEYDQKLNRIGKECEEYVIPEEKELKGVGIPKLFETMTVVFPKCEADFINEGNQQHNCVGSYPSRVRDGYSVVFFIREKSNPEKSFITAECTRSGLGQCYYSNNRHVNNEELIKFAKYIANKIKTGCTSGKIHALSNI